MIRNVLIVEDSNVMRSLLDLAARRLPDVAIDQAGDGVAALKALRGAARPYDLILLDLNMPVMDGMKLLGYLRSDPILEGSVVAIITTEQSSATEEQARSLGARYFLRKPVTRRDIEDLFDEVLGPPE
jgi:two-component system chemotaxis response regulator CheY